MGLPEPVSGSHVAMTTVPLSDPSFNPAPPPCSSILPFSASNPATVHSSPPNTNRPRSVPDPSPPAGSLSDPAPATTPAPSSGAVPPPVAFHRPELALAPCSSADPSSFPPLSASSNPINPNSASSSPHSSSAGPQSSAGPLSSDAGPLQGPVAPSSSHTLAHLPFSAPISAPTRHLRPSSSSVPTGAAPPPRQLSYAQAARSSRGPSFVRAHASAVESFAKIPRTGANIICGSKEGIPSFSFVAADLPRVEDIYHNALVMKFSGGRPSLEASHREILSWGMEKQFSIGPLSSRSFLLRFQDGKDLLTVLTRPSSLLITFPYKVFRWHNLCHIADDSCLAPVWVSLPRLPLQCFIPEFLEAVGNKLGKFLCFDRATTTLARPSTARICVELDLRKPPPQFIWVGLFDGFKQPIIYERMPKYCNGCHRLGHVISDCSKSCNEAAATRYQERTIRSQGRTPPARLYAPKVLSAYSSGGFAPMVDTNITNHGEKLNRQQQPPDVRPSSTATTPSQPATQNCTNQSEEQPPTAPSSQSEEQPPPVQKQPKRSHRADQGQSDLSSLSSTTPKFRFPESSHGLQLPNDTPILSLPADPTLVQLPTLDEPHLTPPTKSKAKTRKIRPKKKSVSFKLPGQSNLSANVDFWSAVNNQLSNIEQNHTHTSNQSIPPNPSAVPIVDNSLRPSIHPNNPNISTSAPPSTCSSVKQNSIIATFDKGKIHPALWEAVNRQVSILDQARLTGSPVVQALLNSSRATVLNPPVSIPSTSNTNLYTMSPSTSDSESSIAADSPPNSSTQSPHGSQYDAFSLNPFSYKSEGEDSGTEEARFQGHFSDDMSSAKPKSSRKNNRHPDQPLNVQLRARKGGGY